VRFERRDLVVGMVHFVINAVHNVLIKIYSKIYDKF
jgi:hypothetical protein